MNININTDMMNIHDAVGNSVYNVLKANIKALNLKPGDRISEQEISKLLNVSRTPVREAFISLSREGLVDVLPQRGTFISRIDLDQVEEARFIRECLELAVVEMVAENAPEDILFKLDALIEQQKSSLAAMSFEEMMDYDAEFHRLIFHAAEKDRSWEVVEQISTHYRMTRLLSLKGHISWEKAIAQHQELVKCFREQDRFGALNVSKNHTRNLKIDQNEIKKLYPDYFK